MPAHSIGSATISFGLVSVPIKMFSAGESSAAISFNWLHKKDGARLKQQYICSKDGEKVENDDRVKGYEFSKGQYVVFSVDELKKLQMDDKSSNSMNITEFVDAATVDRMYMDRAYFLGPDKGGERAFGLLRSEEHTSELQSLAYLVCRLLLEKKNKTHSSPAAGN